MLMGLAAEHGGVERKMQRTATLKAPGNKVTDFSAPSWLQ